MSPAPVAEVFAALGDPRRQHLLEVLGSYAEGASVTTLAAPLPVSRQAVDKHLRVLAHVGLVSSTRVGREVRFVVRREQIETSARWLTQLAQRWDDRLGARKDAAEATSSSADG